MAQSKTDNNPQAFSWSELAAALREEFAAYGSMLSILQAQLKGILKHNAQVILETASQLDEQEKSATQARQHRETLAREAAQAVGLDAFEQMTDLVLHVPVPTRPLFLTLINEINQILGRLQQRIQQNHELLHRASDANRQLLQELGVRAPAGVGATYNRRGKVSKHNGMAGNSIAAAG